MLDFLFGKPERTKRRKGGKRQWRVEVDRGSHWSPMGTFGKKADASQRAAVLRSRGEKVRIAPA